MEIRDRTRSRKPQYQDRRKRRLLLLRSFPDPVVATIDQRHRTEERSWNTESCKKSCREGPAPPARYPPGSRVLTGHARLSNEAAGSVPISHHMLELTSDSP